MAVRTAEILPICKGGNQAKAWNAAAGQPAGGRAGNRPGSPVPWAHLARDPGGPLQLHGGDVLGPSVPAAGPLWMETVLEGW